jgi:hypothetical protein
MKDFAALQQVADQYRQEGYTVKLRPSGTDLPDFLASFGPDLIAQRNGDRVVVQVRSKEDLRSDPALSHLAGVVNAQPGWRFDLVVLDPRKWPDELPNEVTEPGAAGISALVAEAEHLLRVGALRAAFLVACAAAEASLREAARREAIPLDQNDPPFVLDTLCVQGILSYEQYEQIGHWLRVRNAIMHGLQIPLPNSPETEALLGTVRQLMPGQATLASRDRR